MELFYFSRIKSFYFVTNTLLSSNQILPLEGSFMFAQSAFATSEYCFVCRWGGRQGSVKPDDPLPPKQLLVFNWDGILVKAFDEYYNGGRYCYDDEFGMLYTFESSKEENDPYVTVRKYHIGDYLIID